MSVSSSQVTATLANQPGAPQLSVPRGEPLLASLLAQGVDLPYGCRYGGCITCAAKLTAGEVDQSEQVALNNYQIQLGYIVPCVAKPLSDLTLEVGVESHDQLYRNPFLKPLADHQLKADIAGATAAPTANATKAP